MSVSACDCMLHSSVCQPCQECVSWDPIKTCWASVGVVKRMKNVRGGTLDVAMTWMTLEKDVVIVSCPSPWGRWLVQSCKSRTAQKLSICKLAHCGTFPHGVSTAALTSFVNRHLAHQRGLLGGSDYLLSHTIFCFSYKEQTIKKGYRQHSSLQ